MNEWLTASAQRVPDDVDETPFEQHWVGEDRGPDEIKRDFQLYGHTKRAEALDQIDEHLRTIGEVGSGEGELRNYAKLTRLRRDLGKTHADLIKVRR